MHTSTSTLLWAEDGLVIARASENERRSAKERMGRLNERGARAVPHIAEPGDFCKRLSLGNVFYQMANLATAWLQCLPLSSSKQQQQQAAAAASSSSSKQQQQQAAAAASSSSSKQQQQQAAAAAAAAAAAVELAHGSSLTCGSQSPAPPSPQKKKKIPSPFL
jgi:biotin carboxyl carrier protein